MEPSVYHHADIDADERVSEQTEAIGAASEKMSRCWDIALTEAGESVTAPDCDTLRKPCFPPPTPGERCRLPELQTPCDAIGTPIPGEKRPSPPQLQLSSYLSLR